MARHCLPALFISASMCVAHPCLAEDTGAETTQETGTDSAAPPVQVMNADDANPAPGSLYERLGGTAKMSAVVSETIDKMSTNPRTKRTFDRVDLKRVKGMLVQQICSLTGGGCTFDDDSVKDIHAGHGITNADFYTLVETLRTTMRNYDIPLSARNELLAILAPMKRDVVER
jgi:hemoglobin